MDSIEHAATELLEVAQKWEAERARRRDKPRVAAVAPPGDFDLAVARATVLRGNTPKSQWRPWITELDFSGEDFDDLAPLAGLTALQVLILDTTLVSDLSPLARLTALQVLDLGGTQVSDLSPLARLAGLQTLLLDDTQVSDLSPLARLIALERLEIARTEVSNLSPLARLTALRHLFLQDTLVTDLSPLVHISDLEIKGVRNS